MRDILKLFNDAFEEGTIAYSDRIFILIEPDLLEENDEDIEALLAESNVSGFG